MSEFNPAVFTWARERAGLSVEEASHALHLKSDTLLSIEAGAADPTRPQLLNMSKVYRRSLLAFYMPAPPARGDRGQDFRTVVAERTVSAEAAIDALIRDLRARQAVVRSTLEDDEDIHALEFVASASMAEGVQQLSRTILERLSFDRQTFRRHRTSEAAFGYLRERVEGLGVFVLLIGDLGSHHSAIPVEAFRGMAFADPIAPFIVINDQDAHAAWSFTLLHELAHLWLGASGVSAGQAEQQIEQFCNEVAAGVLVPAADVQAEDIDLDSDEELIGDIERLARQWRVSRPMVAYRLLKAGRISAATWSKVDRRLREMWVEECQRERAARKASKSSGPSYYVVRRHRLGSAMLQFAARNLRAGTLSPVKAAQVLGVTPRSVFPLLGSSD